MAACCEQTSPDEDPRRKPVLSTRAFQTIRREVKQVINAALFCLYQPTAKNAF